MATEHSGTSGKEQSAAERFFRYFQHEIIALQEQMARLGDTALVGGERRDATDHCLAGITRLSSEVKDASATVPSYDLRTYTEAIKALQDKLAETQAQHAPKQKFSFKTRKNESAVSLHEAAELAAERRRNLLRFDNASGTSSFATTPVHLMTPPNEPATAQKTLTSTATSSTAAEGEDSQHVAARDSSEGPRPTLTTTATTTTVSSQTNTHIIIPASASWAHTPCTLSNLTSCCVDLSFPTTETTPFASLTVTNVQSSLLICGSIAGPLHITGVKNSTIVISCRQFRMHECKDIDVYLYCTSEPIIEDCTDIRFAETPPFYTDLLHSALPTPNEAIGTNMWERVNDFKWLRPEQSPNWMIMPVEQQIPEELWKAIIPGKPGASLDEILDIASIRR